MARAGDDGAVAREQQPAVDGWELPPARELFWGRQKLQRGGQTVFGDVWAGVRGSITIFNIILRSVCAGARGSSTILHSLFSRSVQHGGQSALGHG